jgi:hypothetical protein
MASALGVPGMVITGARGDVAGIGGFEGCSCVLMIGSPLRGGSGVVHEVDLAAVAALQQEGSKFTASCDPNHSRAGQANVVH